MNTEYCQNGKSIPKAVLEQLAEKSVREYQARMMIDRSGLKKEDNSVFHERGCPKEDVIWLEVDF